MLQFAFAIFSLSSLCAKCLYFWAKNFNVDYIPTGTVPESQSEVLSWQRKLQHNFEIHVGKKTPTRKYERFGNILLLLPVIGSLSAMLIHEIRQTVQTLGKPIGVLTNELLVEG